MSAPSPAMADVPSGLPSPFDPTGFTHVQRGVDDPNETRPHADTPPPANDSRPPNSTRPLSVGRTVGKYEIQAEIGEGGMGRVYKAYDPELKRHVAIKMLRPSTGIDDVSRFRGEAALVAALEHPNIVQIYEIDNDADGRPFLVLEYVDGGGLDAKIHQRLPRPREAAEWTETLALAVQTAHDRGIIHRDLKPANVLVTRTGTLKVSDFGLGKRLDESSGRTQTGDVFGTPGYMAPEQASGKIKQFGPATDVYALGAMLYEFLTGRPPFTGAKVWEIISQVQYADPVAPSVVARGIPRDLNTICLKCLEKAPGRRYQTAKELADDLRRYLDGLHILASPVPWWGKLWRQAKRRPKEAAVTAALAAGAVTIVGLGVYARETERARQHEVEQLEAEQRTKDAQAAREKEFTDRLRDRSRIAQAALDSIKRLVLTENLGNPEPQRRLQQLLAENYKQLTDLDQTTGAAGPAELIARADSIGDLGRLVGMCGDKEQAVRTYRLAEDLYQRAGPATDRQAAVCRRETGRYLADLARFDEAEQAVTAARDKLTALAASADRDTARELAEAWHLFGEIQTQTNRLAGAEKAYTESIALRKRLFDLNPADPQLCRDLARGYGYRGDVYLDLGRTGQADADYAVSQRLREELAQRLLGVEPARLLTDDKAADRIAQDEAAANAVFQVSRAWANGGRLLARVPAHGLAEHFQQRTADLLRKLIEFRPTVTDYRLDLAELLTYMAEGRLVRDPVDRPRAAAELDEARKLFQALHKANATDRRVRSGWARCEAATARLLADGGPAATTAALQQVTALIGDSTRPEDLYTRAATVGLHAEGRQGAADEALALLERAVAAGRFRELHPNTIRADRGFRAVRGRPEFEAALAKMTAAGQ